jgi:hypothetical protein
MKHQTDWNTAKQIWFVSQTAIGFVLQLPGLRSLSATSLSFPCLSLRSFKAHPGAAAVFVDEFHARILKGAFYDLKRRTTRLGPLLFELVDSHDADAGTISQVLLAPAK